MYKIFKIGLIVLGVAFTILSSIHIQGCRYQIPEEVVQWEGTPFEGTAHAAVSHDGDHYIVKTTEPSQNIYLKAKPFYTAGREYKLSVDVKNGSASNVNISISEYPGTRISDLWTTSSQWQSHSFVFTKNSEKDKKIFINIHESLEGGTIHIRDFNIERYLSEDENMIFGEETVVGTNFEFCMAVFSGDIDNDGDNDIVGASDEGGSEISWWENKDGKGTTWAKHVVDNNFNAACSVYLIDIDNDGDKDIVGTAYFGNEVAWFENGNGWEKHVIGADFDGAVYVCSGDIDNDGLNDVLAVAAHDDEVALWYNKGSDIWRKRVIAEHWADPRSVRIADMDNDGDLDIIGSSYNYGDCDVHHVADCECTHPGNNKSVAWWENNNDEWKMFIIDSANDSSFDAFPYDVDEDGDMDIVSNDIISNSIICYENTSGGWIKNVVDSDFRSARMLHVADIDLDGDGDIVGAAYADNEISYWENVGKNCSSWKKHCVAGDFIGSHALHMADLNGNGSLDIVGGANIDDKISWWENTLDLSKDL